MCFATSTLSHGKGREYAHCSSLSLRALHRFDGIDVRDRHTDRTDTVIFPTSQDTWEIYYYPYWWHVGDTVHGDHDVSLTSVNHADVEFYLVYNSLVPDCGFVDLEFQIDGTVVGTLTVWPEDNMGPVNASFDFADMTPPFELRYHETNLVAPGCGSISLDESGMNTVTFSGGPSPAEPPSWAAIKALFR